MRASRRSVCSRCADARAMGASSRSFRAMGKPCDDAHVAMQATCVHRGVANSREKHCGLAVIELTAAHGTDDHTAERTSPHGPFLVLAINPGHRTLALERPTAWRFHVKHRVHDAHLLDRVTWDGLHWDHTDGNGKPDPRHGVDLCISPLQCFKGSPGTTHLPFPGSDLRWTAKASMQWLGWLHSNDDAMSSVQLWLKPKNMACRHRTHLGVQGSYGIRPTGSIRYPSLLGWYGLAGPPQIARTHGRVCCFT